MARIGVVLTMGVVVGWLALMLMLNVMALPTPGVVQPTQTLQRLGVMAIIPAILDLSGAMRRGTGWRRIVMVSPLLTGLAGTAWWVWTGNALF